MATRLFGPAIDLAGSRIASSSNVSNSFALLNPLLEQPHLWKSTLRKTRWGARRALILSLEACSGTEGKHRGRVRTSESSRYERRFRSAFDPYGVTGSKGGEVAVCSAWWKERGIMVAFACVSLSTPASVSLDIILSDRKWQWVNLNHGSSSAEAALWWGRFLNQALKITGGNILSGVDSEWRDTSPAPQQMLAWCKHGWWGVRFFFYFTICSTCKRVAFIATLINPGWRNFHFNFNRPTSTSCYKVQSWSRKGLFAMLVKRHQSLGALPSLGQQHQQQYWKECTSEQGRASMNSKTSRVIGDASRV